MTHIVQCKLTWVAEIQKFRKLLNNALWKKLKSLFLAKAGKGRDSRQLIDADCGDSQCEFAMVDLPAERGHCKQTHIHSKRGGRREGIVEAVSDNRIWQS